jgi:hypothetical protein
MSLIKFGTIPELARPAESKIIVPAFVPRPGGLPIDADEIAPRLWQGADPPRGGVLRNLGFRGVVLCAQEHQYAPRDFPGVRVVNAPMDDAWYVASETARAAAAAGAELWRRGAKVLVVCHMGINRSGLVSALILRNITGCSGAQAVAAVKRKRPGALSNRAFVKFLERLAPRKSA